MPIMFGHDGREEDRIGPYDDWGERPPFFPPPLYCTMTDNKMNNNLRLLDFEQSHNAEPSLVKIYLNRVSCKIIYGHPEWMFFPISFFMDIVESFVFIFGHSNVYWSFIYVGFGLMLDCVVVFFAIIFCLCTRRFQHIRYLLQCFQFFFNIMFYLFSIVGSLSDLQYVCEVGEPQSGNISEYLGGDEHSVSPLDLEGLGDSFDDWPDSPVRDSPFEFVRDFDFNGHFGSYDVVFEAYKHHFSGFQIYSNDITRGASLFPGKLPPRMMLLDRFGEQIKGPSNMHMHEQMFVFAFYCLTLIYVETGDRSLLVRLSRGRQIWDYYMDHTICPLVNGPGTVNTLSRVWLRFAQYNVGLIDVSRLQNQCGYRNGIFIGCAEVSCMDRPMFLDARRSKESFTGLECSSLGSTVVATNASLHSVGETIFGTYNSCIEKLRDHLSDDSLFFVNELLDALAALNGFYECDSLMGRLGVLKLYFREYRLAMLAVSLDEICKVLLPVEQAAPVLLMQKLAKFIGSFLVIANFSGLKISPWITSIAEKHFDNLNNLNSVSSAFDSIISFIVYMGDIFRDVLQGDNPWEKIFGSKCSRAVEEAMFLVNSDGYVDPSKDKKSSLGLLLEERVDRLQKVDYQLRTLDFSKSSFRPETISSLRNSVSTCLQRDLDIMNHADTIVMPFCIMFCGPPGCGKTTMISQMHNIVCGVLGYSPRTAKILSKKDTDDFEDSNALICSNCVTIKVDEFHGKPDAKAGMASTYNPYEMHNKMIQEEPFRVKRAFNKNDDCIRASLVCMTTNREGIDPTNYWLDRDAVSGRFHMVVKMIPNGWTLENRKRNLPPGMDPDNAIKYVIMYIEKSPSGPMPFKPSEISFTSEKAFLSYFVDRFKDHRNLGVQSAMRKINLARMPECSQGIPKVSHVIGRKCGLMCDLYPDGESDDRSIHIPSYNLVSVLQNGGTYHILFLSFVIFCQSIVVFRIRHILLSLILKYEDRIDKIVDHAQEISQRVRKFEKFSFKEWIDRKKVFLYLGTFVGVCGGLKMLQLLIKSARDGIDSKKQMGGQFSTAYTENIHKMVEMNSVVNPTRDERREWKKADDRTVFRSGCLISNPVELVSSAIYVISRENGTFQHCLSFGNVILTNYHFFLNDKRDNFTVSIMRNGPPVGQGTKYIVSFGDIYQVPDRDLCLINVKGWLGKNTHRGLLKNIRSTRDGQYNGFGFIVGRDATKISGPVLPVTLTDTDHRGVIPFHFRPAYKMPSFVSKGGDCGMCMLDTEGVLIGMHFMEGGLSVPLIKEDIISVILKMCKDDESLAMNSGVDMSLYNVDGSVMQCGAFPDNSIWRWFRGDGFEIGTLPGVNANRREKFTTREALGSEVFSENLISECGDPYGCPSSSRKLGSNPFPMNGVDHFMVGIEGKCVPIDCNRQMRAMKAYVNDITRSPSIACRPLTVQETIYELKSSTSSGLLWGILGKSPKSKLLNSDMVFDEMFQRSVVDYIERLDHSVCPLVTSVCYKDEPIKKKKIDQGKCRIFNVCQAHENFVGIMFFKPLIDFLIRNKYFSEVALGMNVHSMSWKDLYSFLTFEGKTILLGMLDGQHFDLSPDGGSAYTQAYFWRSIARFCQYSIKQVRIVNNLVLSCVWHFVIVNGDCVLVNVANPSGGWLTTAFNCVENARNMREVWDYQGRDLRVFVDNVHMMTFGDDLVLGFLNDCGYNQQTIVSDAKLFSNFIYTSGRKDDFLPKFEKIEDVTFLKRSFSFRNGHVLAPLDKTSIWKMLAWEVPGDLDQYERFRVVSRNALMESWLHNEDFYELVLSRIDLVENKYSVVGMNKPSFDEVGQLYADGLFITQDA